MNTPCLLIVATGTGSWANGNMAMPKTSINTVHLSNPIKGLPNTRFGQDLTKELRPFS